MMQSASSPVAGPFHSHFGVANGYWLRSTAEVPVPVGQPTLPRQTENQTALATDNIGP
jgi:hypothetical protein